MRLDDLLAFMDRPADREEFLRLGRRWNDNRLRRERAGAAGHGPPGDPDTGRPGDPDTERRELLEQLMERVQWHLRAARHPLPGPEELEDLLARYFGR